MTADKIKNMGIKNVETACETESRRVRTAHYVMTPRAQRQAKNQLVTFKRQHREKQNAN